MKAKVKDWVQELKEYEDDYIKCDNEGIPKIVQNVEFIDSDLFFYVNLFNGSRIGISAECYHIYNTWEYKEEVLIDIEDDVENMFLTGFLAVEGLFKPQTRYGKDYMRVDK